MPDAGIFQNGQLAFPGLQDEINQEESGLQSLSWGLYQKSVSSSEAVFCKQDGKSISHKGPVYFLGFEVSWVGYHLLAWAGQSEGGLISTGKNRRRRRRRRRWSGQIPKKTANLQHMSNPHIVIRVQFEQECEQGDEPKWALVAAERQPEDE